MRGPPRISLRSSSRICAGSKREAKIGARFVNHAPEARAPNLPSEMKHPDIARQLGRDLKGVAFPTVVPTRLTCDQTVTCLHGCPRCRKTKRTVQHRESASAHREPYGPLSLRAAARIRCNPPR